MYGLNFAMKNVKLTFNCLVNIFSIDIRRGIRTSTVMANSKWDYVRSFESEQIMLPNCWAVARIDGRGFHKLAKTHNWKRPNDERGLKLMNRAAKTVMAEFNDIILAYGQSDEYSFIFRREAEVFQRRSTKIITTLVSKFASSYVYNWKGYFPDVELAYAPSFDGRIVLYPTDQNLRDYLCWRQADCHINNLYNTTFWALVQQGGLSNTDAEKELSGTLSGDKNEILFSRFNTNYNNEPELYKKGTVLVQPAKNRQQQRMSRSQQKRKQKLEKKLADKQNSIRHDPELGDSESAVSSKEHQTQFLSDALIELNCDIIGDAFWNQYPYLLNPQVSVEPENNKNQSESQEQQQQNQQNLVTS